MLVEFVTFGVNFENTIIIAFAHLFNVSTIRFYSATFCNCPEDACKLYIVTPKVRLPCFLNIITSHDPCLIMKVYRVAVVYF